MQKYFNFYSDIIPLLSEQTARTGLMELSITDFV